MMRSVHQAASGRASHERERWIMGVSLGVVILVLLIPVLRPSDDGVDVPIAEAPTDRLRDAIEVDHRFVRASHANDTPPGWFQNEKDQWIHQYYADVPPFVNVDLVERTGRRSRPDWELPSWWRLSDGKFVDKMLGDATMEWPMGFQNEAAFREFYQEVCSKVRGTIESDSLETRVEALEWAVKGALLLEDGASEKRILEEARRSFREHIGIVNDGGTTGTMKVLFLVGDDSDHYFHNAKYHLPMYLQEAIARPMPGVRQGAVPLCTQYGFERPHLVHPDRKVTKDLAIAYFLRYFFAPAIDVEVLDACFDLGKLRDTTYLDKYDVVFRYYNPEYHPNGQNTPLSTILGPVSLQEYHDAFQRTTAVVWPPRWMNFNDNKSRLPDILLASGVPCVKAFHVAFPDSSTDATRWASDDLVRSVLKRAQSLRSDVVFLKPDASSFSYHVEKLVLGRGARRRLQRYIARVRAFGSPGFSVQRYVRTFKEHYEIRAFFIGGEEVFAVANKHDPHPREAGEAQSYPRYAHWDTLDRDGGVLNATALRYNDVLVGLARRAIDGVIAAAPPDARLPDGVAHHPMMRVDMGCCLEPEDDEYDETTGGWFVSEIELTPDFSMNLFTKLLVNTLENTADSRESESERMTLMVERAAAASYPLVERFGLEASRFVEAVRRSKE